MSNRWHMNRMGFVNFWLYDEETFSFHDGKLLLRGQNGSGKSITTQSFIPFILDGDRSPSRLDPFGSSDRRMEYYFLGDEGREEATGYLFLEFKREHLDQYRTIGIGQRAQKGKPMAFWGFLILDGRRIGYDLWLYREAGASKISYSKQELRQLLGEDNPVTDVQRDYMELVNKYIFGFSSLEQYGQFIKLLMKVRAPKLSKEFKPSKVYEILNDSLRTLTDEDLRSMVEAMENMDDIQEKLEHLKEAYQGLTAIRKEYHRYNQYMLGKKAQAYVEEKKRVDSIRGQLEAWEQEYQEKGEEIHKRREEEKRLQDEIRVLDAEKDTLQLEGMEESMDKLKKARKAKEQVQEEKQAIEARLEQSREQILVKDGELRACQGRIDACGQDLKNGWKELEEENETVQFFHHGEIRECLDIGRREEFLTFQKEIKQLEHEIAEGYEAQKKLYELQKQWDREEEKRQKLLMQKQEAQTRQQAAEQWEDECRDELIEAIHRLAAENQEMSLAGTERDALVQMVQKYNSPLQFGEILDYYYRIWTGKNRILEGKRLEKESERNQSQKEKKRLQREMEEIRAMPMPAPVQKKQTQKARAVLKEREIPFLPFYEAVEFAGEMSQEGKNRLEGQLEAAGLLDALVVPAEAYERAKLELSGLSDVLISPAGTKGKQYPYLRCADVEPEFVRAVEEILSHIQETEEPGSTLVLSSDGYFKNGLLKGWCQGQEEASYIGASARKRKKERLLQEKQTELEQEELHLAGLEQELSRLRERLGILQKERETFPSFGDLNQGIDRNKSCQEEVKRYTGQAAEQEEAAEFAQNAVKEQEQQVLKICRPLPYFRTLEAYEEARAGAVNYQDILEELGHILMVRETERQQADHIREITEREKDRQETDYEYLRQAQQRIRELDIQIQRISEYLEDPKVKRMAERLARIKEEQDEKTKALQENKTRLAVLESQMERLVSEVQSLKERAVTQIARETKLREYFAQELALGLIVKQEGAELYEAAEAAKGQVRESDQNRSGAEMTTALMKTFHAHFGSVSSYGAVMEECFSGGDDSTLLHTRQRISAIWKGKKLYLEDFYGVIQEAIDNTELLIRKTERDMFEGVLADNLSRKLTSRIRESRNWIRDMSNLMKGMDTSMALTFSLEWKPKTTEGEQELDTKELEKILARERELLTEEDMEKVSAHFRTKIHNAKRSAQENGDAVNYMELVRDALDYRKWFEFCMYYYRNEENKKELTNGAFNRFSGGEKAMAMYVPLFAAVNAQYKKAEYADHPRIIALDEAFAGVDDKNISSMFELVEKLDFDYIMNSQVLWGCYDTVKKLRIAELLRPGNSNVVTVIYYTWNGHERMLDEQ